MTGGAAAKVFRNVTTVYLSLLGYSTIRCMAYLLSATKLKSYARCPRAYYFRYECGLNEQGAFASAALGTALHGALAQLYQDWHYQEPLPSEAWLRYFWEKQIAGLTDKQNEEGWQILNRY